MAGVPMDFNPCKPSSSIDSDSEEDWNVGTENTIAFDSSDQINNNSNYNSSTIIMIDSFLQRNSSQSSPDTYNATHFQSKPADTLITNPIYLTLTAGSIIGNLAMLCVILLTPRFRKPANYLIVNLSLTSILFIVSANLRLVQNTVQLWDFTTFRCQVLAVLHRIPVPLFALTTMVISLDRGRVARNPMNCSYSISPAWKILFIWSFSVLIVIPLAFTRVYDECNPLAFKCAKVLLFGQPSVSMLYGILYLMSVHIIPAVILIRESMKTQKIMKFLKLSNIEHLHMQLQCAITPYNTNTLSDNRLRLLRNSCFFTANFLILWLPYGIFQFPLDLPKEILPELLEIYVRFYFRFVRNIAYMQIALTPVLLFALSYDLRMYLNRVDCDFGWRKRLRGHYHHHHNNNNNSRYHIRNHVFKINDRHS